MRSVKIVSISLSHDLSEEVSEIAKEERRTISEVFREALRQYAAGRIVSKVRKHVSKVAKKKGIKPEDVEDIIDEDRE
ncbi:MAG: hypothetical protein A3B70_03480 [Deltaproteobacteria bacterium RIFCSPHIGHO2_02_FULL_40_11]|nr:MAG: hypothetical protein A3B70_03480 [Deltaproteobacteria bacterium RIFCSPHIGHO2_02_FULL_40_11]